MTVIMVSLLAAQVWYSLNLVKCFSFCWSIIVEDKNSPSRISEVILVVPENGKSYKAES